ncbi:hypothetical protein RGUI_3329 [Rhodovulum sp. P5]|nr:hypothetical protein RGUI_3329 [Rhodovulum sp. P5]
MFVDLGEARAEGLIEMSVGRIEELLARLAIAAEDGRPETCAGLAREIRAVSDMIGLLSLSWAARGVERAALSRDPVALAATRDRLRRMALRSFRLTEELRHRSG